MKNLKHTTAIAAFFLLSVVFLGGCTMTPNEGILILGYETTGDGKCHYHAEEINVAIRPFYEFIDSCGKFNVGDTLRWQNK